MTKSFLALKQQTEVSFSQIGRQQSKKFHQRVEEIIKLLRRKYPITDIKMGMGIWSVDGEPFIMRYDDGDEVLQDEAIYEYFSGCGENDNRYIRLKGWTAGDEKLACELNDILNYLTDEPYMGIRDWKFA